MRPQRCTGFQFHFLFGASGSAGTHLGFVVIFSCGLLRSRGFHVSLSPSMQKCKKKIAKVEITPVM
jgi:hypothetical protein